MKFTRTLLASALVALLAACSNGAQDAQKPADNTPAAARASTAPAAAAPASTVVSSALVPVFAALAVIGLVPAYYLLRGLRAGPAAGTAGGPAAPLVPAVGRRGWPAWAITGIALFLAIGAIYGGTELIRNGFGMPLRWLSQTPFTGWTLPGLALLIGVAVPQLAVAALIAASHRRALAASYLAGLVLIAWIAVQLLVLQRYFFLQPVIAGLGLAELLLAGIWHRRAGSGAAPAHPQRAPPPAGARA